MIIEPWLGYSFGNAVCSTGYSLSVKKGDEYIDHLQLTSYFLLVSAIINLIYFIIKKKNIFLSKWAISNGIFGGLSLIFLNNSISKAKNPGLSMSIFRTQAVLTYIASIFLFHSSISKMKIAGIITVIIGAFIITSFNEKEKIENFNKNKEKTHNNKEWLLYAFAAGIFMTFKDITTKISLSKQKIDLSVYVFISLASASITSFIYQFIKTKNIKLESKQKNKKYEKYIYVLIIAFINIVYAITIGLSTSQAPNPGIPKAIDSAGIILTLILSKFLFKNSEINKKQWLGVIILIIGVIAISL